MSFTYSQGTNLNFSKVKLIQHNSEASLKSNDHIFELREVAVENQIEHLNKCSKGEEKYAQETIQIFPTPIDKEISSTFYIVLLLILRTWLGCKSTKTFYC